MHCLLHLIIFQTEVSKTVEELNYCPKTNEGNTTEPGNTKPSVQEFANDF